MILRSIAFKDNESMPAKYTCDGDDVSPELEWSGAPEDTMSYTIIMDDPDAYPGAFTHWSIYNLPLGTNKLPQGVVKKTQLPDGSSQGKNDFNDIGYGGPCPPPGKPHHYVFTLYALDRNLNISGGASKKQILQTMKDHILAQVKLTGIYQR